MAQWTIDPRLVADGRVSADVAAKAVEVFEARVIVRTSRRVWRVPSWTTRGRWYPVVLTTAPDGWKAVCPCDSVDWCHHGFAAALEAEQERRQTDPDFRIPVPKPVAPRRRGTTTTFTVIPGGAA